MADNSMENLISNYGDMSIEELGSSLLQRQSDIAAQRAKEAKKNRRFQQAIGLLTAGQAIFKNATQKRLKELDDLQAFNMQDNVEQSQQIKTLGRIGANMPNQEWFAERKDMDVNTITKEILNDDRYGKNLQQNLAPVIDAAIKQGVPEEEYAMFKKGTSEYDTAFQLGLHNLINNYVSPHVDAKGKKTGKRNFEMYESELRKLLNERDLDSAKLFEQAIAITPGRLNQAEKRYYARLKSEYANRGYIESFKDIFRKIGRREEQQGRFNLFRNVEQTDLYGSDINDILTTLNIEGPLITSIDKSLAQYRGSATQALVSAKTDPDLVSRANTAIETYGRNLGNKKLYNSDNTLKMSVRGEASWNRYTEDFTENQKQVFAQDVAGLANAFQDDTDFALAAFSSTLKDRGEEVTDDMLAEFYQKITGPDNENYRLNIAIAVASNEGFAAGGGFLGRKPEYYRDSFDKVAQKYKYDRFKGSIPALLGEGISVPSQTNTGNYQEDASYSKMDKDSRKIAFDNQLKFIEQSKLSPTSKMKLIENLFENVRQPEFTTPQEYLEAYPPQSRKPEYRYVFIAGPTGGYTARIPVNVPERNNIINERKSFKVFQEQLKTKPEEIYEELPGLATLIYEEEGLGKRKGKVGSQNTRVYKDSLGILTAGVGHQLSEAEKEIYKEGDTVPVDVVENWLREDIKTAHNDAISKVQELRPELLDNEEMMTIISSFYYQLGKSRGDGFKNMWEAFEEGNGQEAYNQALYNYNEQGKRIGKTRWHTQTGNRARRFAEFLRDNV